MIEATPPRPEAEIFRSLVELSRNPGRTRRVVHGCRAAAMLKMVDGGAYTSGLLALVILVWVAVGLASLSEYILPRAFDLGV